MSNEKFNSDRKLVLAFRAIFPEHSGEIKIIDSLDSKGNNFHYAQNKENRLKVFHDRVEVWEKTDTKNPVKTLELTKETIQALNKLYEEDSVL